LPVSVRLAIAWIGLLRILWVLGILRILRILRVILGCCRRGCCCCCGAEQFHETGHLDVPLRSTRKTPGDLKWKTLSSSLGRIGEKQPGPAFARWRKRALLHERKRRSLRRDEIGLIDSHLPRPQRLPRLGLYDRRFHRSALQQRLQ